MKLSSKSQYGLRACYILALNPDKPMSASTLEKEISVSSKYIEKIMRMLCGAGITVATRGANGGYVLSKSAEQITVGDIVRTLEDNMEIVGCVTASCKKCASGSVWKRLYDGINKVLDEITLQSMVDDFKQMPACHCKTECDCNK